MNLGKNFCMNYLHAPRLLGGPNAPSTMVQKCNDMTLSGLKNRIGL
jgi:hypothetical protein